MCLLLDVERLERRGVQVVVMKEEVVIGRPAEAAAYFKLTERPACSGIVKML